MAACRSTSDHRRPRASPRLQPVSARKFHAGCSRSFSLADCSRNDASSSTVHVRSSARTAAELACGGSAASEGLRVSRPQRTASLIARWRMAATKRTVRSESPRSGFEWLEPGAWRVLKRRFRVKTNISVQGHDLTCSCRGHAVVTELPNTPDHLRSFHVCL